MNKNKIEKKILIIDPEKVFSFGLSIALKDINNVIFDNYEYKKDNLKNKIKQESPDYVIMGVCKLRDLEVITDVAMLSNINISDIILMIDEHYLKFIPNFISDECIIILRNSTPERIRDRVIQHILSAEGDHKHKCDTVSHNIFDNTSLTPAEKKVLNEIAKGNTVTEVSRKLNKSVKTISSQKRSGFNRLGFKNSQEFFRFIAKNDMKLF